MDFRKKISKIILNKKICFVPCIISLVFGTFLGLLNPLMLKFILDDIIIKNNLSYLPIITLILVIILLFETLFAFFNRYLLSFLLEVSEKEFKISFLKKLCSIKLVDFSNQPSEEYINNYIIDIKSIFLYIGELFSFFLQVCLSILFVITILFSYNVELAAVSIVFIPVYIVVLFFTKKYSQNKYNEMRQLAGEENLVFKNNIDCMGTIRLFNSIKYRIDKFSIKLKEIVKKNISIFLFENAISSMLYAISTLSPIMIIIFGVNLIAENKITIGMLIVFYTYIFKLIPLINRFVNFFYTTQRVKNSIDKIDSIYSASNEVIINESNMRLHFEKIDIQEITVTKNNKTLIKNISFSVARGEHCCLFGKNGSGKSTILNVISKFYDPDYGHVNIDDIDIKYLNQEYYYRNISYLTQNCFLLNDSIYNNITMGDEYNEDEVISICKKLNIFNFITSLENGFNHLIIGNGEKFSGGERKMICLARTLLRKPKLILFDEFTNELDIQHKNIIINLIKNDFKDSIFIFVTHDKNELLLAKKIIHIDNGYVIEIINDNDISKITNLLE